MSREPRVAAGLERPALVWDLGDGKPPTFVLSPGQKLTIGRDATNGVVIDSSFVSKFHAAVHWRGGECLVEDLGSANGTLVNSMPVRVHELREGDVIEIGDQKFHLKDTATDKRARRFGVAKSSSDPGGAKAVRLGLTAVVTLVGMTTLLTSLAPGRAAAPKASTVVRRDVVVPERPASAPAVASSVDLTLLIDSVQRKAVSAGVAVPDALFDEAQSRYTAGRLLEAHVLYDAASRSQPPHPLAKRRFEQVSMDLERTIAVHQAEGERALALLRYDDAAVEWEQVLQLTDDKDPRHGAAIEALKRAKDRRPK